MRYNVQRGYRPEPWNAPRAARKPEASLRAVQARAGYAGGRPRAAPRCCSLATLECVCLPPRTSAFSKPFCNVLWSIYATERSVFTLGTPIASNSRYAIVPVASCVRVWSILIPISLPFTISPSTRCADSIFSANPESDILISDKSENDEIGMILHKMSADNSCIILDNVKSSQK